MSLAATAPDHGQPVVHFTVNAWDVNCAKQIPQRFEADNLEAQIYSRDERIAALVAEVERLRSATQGFA